MTQIKQLSFWAKNHKWSSRFIIVFAFIIMSFLGIVTGFLFNSLDVIFTPLILLSVILIFILAWLKYPLKKVNANTKEKNRSYILQKSYDLILIGSTFIMFVYFGNRQTSPVNYFVLTTSAVNSSSKPKDSTNTYKSINEFKKMMKDENGKTLKWKERKKLLKKQIKAIEKANDLSASGKVFLIILCVLLAVLLAYGVAALACSLSCSGAEGAAVVVAILGLAGVILLTVFLIRSIIRKSKKDKQKEVKPEAETINK
jgi:membrane protein implicated in regulation of membrane protease activity